MQLKRLFFTRKDRKICNLEAKVKNRDEFIGVQHELITSLLTIINSLEDDLSSLREENYNLSVTRKTKTKTKTTTRKKATKKETTSKNTTSKK